MCSSEDSRDGSGTCIRARLFDEDCVAAGTDFLLNSTISGSLDQPALAELAGGGLATAWYSSDAGDGSGAASAGGGTGA